MGRRVIFRRNARDIIKRLLEKYGLTDDLLERCDDLFDAKEKEELRNSSISYEAKKHRIHMAILKKGGAKEFLKKIPEPNYTQLVKILREVELEEIFIYDLNFVLRDCFDISQETAKMLAEDIVKTRPYIIETILYDEE